ncbi:MAG: Lrp/AsnC ligand binding domain-containing protein [Prevotellaceae bacterium]|jgi:Lrp/AsnC family transcriptional regulator for asnA, asnC and gidA|nr:Lrp/AsnC ligand binding domain-containing protein [Prevotellaceae bacterium]
MANYTLDNLDRKILACMANNSKVSFTDVARECSISPAGAYQRVKKLEELGILVSSRFTVRPEALGYSVCAFIGVQLSVASMYTDVVSSLALIREIVECHYVTGEYTVLLKIYCKDNNHLLSILSEQIHKIQGVSNTYTFVSLDKFFERQLNLKVERDEMKKHTK